ncbi:MAG: sigma-70 family RNA polymerase sigma factor [Clostridia bacterium]
MDQIYEKSLEICAKFDTFIKKCLRNEARDINDHEQYLTDHESLFSELPDYFVENLRSELEQAFFLHTFKALHYSVTVENDRLSEALQMLSDQKRTIILLHYFLDMSDYEISKLTHTQQERVKKTRQRTLNDLRKNMEDTHDET